MDDRMLVVPNGAMPGLAAVNGLATSYSGPGTSGLRSWTVFRSALDVKAIVWPAACVTMAENHHARTRTFHEVRTHSRPLYCT